MNRYYVLNIFFSIIILGFVFVACKKETEKLPYNLIEQFIVTDNEGSQVKAVVGVDGTILIYWPTFQHIPDSIIPSITVSKNATVQPASGVPIVFSDGFKYRVTAENGNITEYTLKTVVNNPMPEFSLSDTVFLAFDKKMVLRGKFFIPDTSQTKLFLVNAENNETAQVYPFDRIYSTTIETSLPTNLPESQYFVKLVSGFNTIVKGPYRIRTYDNAFANQTSYNFTFTEQGQTLTNGQIINFNFTTSGGPIADYFIKLQQLTVYSTGNNYAKGFDAERISLTDHSVSYKIPNDVPAGNVILIIWVESGSGADGQANLFVFNGDPGTSIVLP
jgi:hypothetical protein